MYSEIKLEKLWALLKELYETSPDAWISITVGTSDACRVTGGMIDFCHNKAKPIQKGNIHADPNPNLRVRWQSEEFLNWCRKRGIEPELQLDQSYDS